MSGSPLDLLTASLTHRLLNPGEAFPEDVFAGPEDEHLTRLDGNALLIAQEFGLAGALLAEELVRAGAESAGLEPADFLRRVLPVVHERWDEAHGLT